MLAANTHVLNVDASGKVTFPITAVDPDPDDRNNPMRRRTPDPVERVRVTYTVTHDVGGPLVDPADPNSGQAAVTDGTATVTFSDARGVPRIAAVTLKPASDYLMAPTSGSANNVVTVTVVDQYGKPVREPSGAG